MSQFPQTQAMLYPRKHLPLSKEREFTLALKVRPSPCEHHVKQHWTEVHGWCPQPEALNRPSGLRLLVNQRTASIVLGFTEQRKALLSGGQRIKEEQVSSKWVKCSISGPNSPWLQANDYRQSLQACLLAYWDPRLQWDRTAAGYRSLRLDLDHAMLPRGSGSRCNPVLWCRWWEDCQFHTISKPGIMTERIKVYLGGEGAARRYHSFCI